MLVVKKMGDWVTHISRSVTARLMMNMLAGVRRLRLLRAQKPRSRFDPVVHQQGVCTFSFLFSSHRASPWSSLAPPTGGTLSHTVLERTAPAGKITEWAWPRAG